MPFPIEIRAWAVRHHVGEDALGELAAMLGSGGTEETGASESNVQSRVRLAAPGLGARLWRNNVGALLDDRGVPVRYGLANDTKALNDRLKSADLIGWRRVLITADMVGSGIAQFTSIECKAEGWKFTGSDREIAQQRWATLVAADGGYAKIVTGPEQLG